MSKSTDNDIIVQNQETAVAQETVDSRRTPQISVVNDREYSNQVFITPQNPSSSTDSHSQEYGKHCLQFSEGQLPLPRSGDTTALSEREYARSLSITSSSRCTALALGEDLPNEAATPEKLEPERLMELREGLDAVCRGSNVCGDDRNILQLAALILGRLGMGGGGATTGGSHTESNHTESAFQGRHHMAEYTGSGLDSHVVTGWRRGSVREEHPISSNAQRDVSMDLFPATTVGNTLPSVISQFNPNPSDQPLRSLEEVEEEMYPHGEFLEPPLQPRPTEETSAPSLPSNPVMEETELHECGHPVFSPNPVQQSHLQGPTVTPMAKSLHHSRSFEDSMIVIPLPTIPGKSHMMGALPGTPPSSHECSHKGSAEVAAEYQLGKKNSTKKRFTLFAAMRGSPEVKAQFLPYTMNKKREHGLVLIIANERFQRHPDGPKRKVLPRRRSARVDMDRLSELWTSLGYRVRVETDQTAEQIKRLFEEIRVPGDPAKTIQWGDDSFVCCISSHGTWDPALGTDVVFGVEGVRMEQDGQVVVKGAVDIRALAYETLSDSCPQLKGQPKLFFIQACRGGKHRRVAGSTVSRTDIPPETDYLFMYASAPGKRAFRDDPYGSFFISDFCALMKQHTHEHDLISILQAVAQKETVLDDPYELRNDNGDIVQITRQSPNFSSSLRGPVFFLNEARKRYKKYHGL